MASKSIECMSWSQKIHHNIKKYVMVSKSMESNHDIKKYGNYVITSNNMSRHQKARTSKVFHDLKKYGKHVMTSKNMSWYKKVWNVHHEVILNVRHDIKKYNSMGCVKRYLITSTNTPWCPKIWKVSHDVKSTSWHQKLHCDVKKYGRCLIVLKSLESTSWRQKIRHVVKKYVMT